ncbi:hypothetical protein V8E36_004750 [Tilletia maclaganii]
MAGPSLEVFKFGLYLFFPLAIMVHYGDPEWYHKHVLPVRDSFWPREETLYQPPRTAEDVKTALEEYRQKRIARKESRADAPATFSQRTTAPTLSSSKASIAASNLNTRPRDVQGSVPTWVLTASRRLV